MGKEAFLARVREAARVGRAFRVTPPDELSKPLASSPANGGDLPARLAEEIDAVGGHAQLAADWPEASTILAQLLDRYRPKVAMCWQHPALEALGMGALLAERNVQRL